MSSTLYRKYRPQTFADVFGQGHIVQTLSNAILNGRAGQAYLFTGPRGTGKTTMARLFAKAVNCENSNGAEPCMKCDICKNITQGKSLDVFEIDAASNTGVENIRELRETVKLPPSQAKYKIYIIDEVHMLSTGAFNALLKTLEEPPAHAIFILATTEIHKVPGTIISRCQRFDFTKISIENIIKKLSKIAGREGIEIEKAALEAIAISAEGGMRDAESLLAQVISLEDKKITSKEVEDILGTTKHQSVEDFTEAILEKDTHKALRIIDTLSNDGFDLEVFHKSTLNYIRQLLLISIDESLSKTFSFELTTEQTQKIIEICKKTKTDELLKILEILSEIQGKMRTSFIPQLPLEIAVVRITKNISSQIEAPKNITTQAQQTQSISKNSNIESPIINEKKKTFSESNADAKKSEQFEEKPAEINQENKTIINSPEKGKIFEISDITNIWPEACQQIIKINHSLAALLPHSMPAKAENGTLTIITKYGLYKDKLMENTNRLTVEGVFANLLGAKVIIKALTEDESGIKLPEKRNAVPTFGQKTGESNKPSSLLTDAASLLGGKIVE